MPEYRLQIKDTVFKPESKSSDFRLKTCQDNAAFVVQMSDQPSAKIIFTQGSSGTVIPSSDTGNIITVGNDGNLFAKNKHLIFNELQPLP